MKALIVIDIDETHLHKETMKLYDRLKGYKCELKPVPARRLLLVPNNEEQNVKLNRIWDDGWNACIDAIEGETE